MKLILDTNVILDVLLDRAPFSLPAARLLAAVEQEKVQAVLCATTLTTIHYLVGKARGPTVARRAVRSLCELFAVASVDRDVIFSAVHSPFRDFEDSVLHEAGKLAGADILVTRDAAGFKKASLLVLSPEEALARLEMTEAD